MTIFLKDEHRDIQSVVKKKKKKKLNEIYCKTKQQIRKKKQKKTKE